jgi:hypothetical protein
MPRPAVLLACVLVTTAVLLDGGARAASAPQPALAEDTFADSAAPAARHGSAPFLRINASSTAYVRFDVSALPAGGTVAAATLSVRVGRLGAPGTLRIHAAGGPWTEDALTHAQQPTASAEPVAALEVSDSTAFTEDLKVDVTGAVQAWLSGAPNHGFALVGAGGLDVDLLSKEFMPDSRPVTLHVVAIPPAPAQ